MTKPMNSYNKERLAIKYRGYAGELYFCDYTRVDSPTVKDLIWLAHDSLMAAVRELESEGDARE
jgi:hypothetical protein